MTKRGTREHHPLRYCLCIALIIILNSFACNQAAIVNDSNPHPFHPEWSKHSNIYEVNIRQYTPEGTFNAFEKHLPRLKEMGVDILWLMPIQPIGKIKRKGILGSYYSISDYSAINPEFGSKKRWVREAIVLFPAPE